MRVGVIGFGILLTIAGCATKPPPAPPVATPEPPPVYQELTASALVFEHPIILNQPPLELSRDLRQPSAFIGYDGPITTYYWIHTDDWQDNSWCDPNGSVGDRYQRRALIDTAGVRYR